MNTASLSRALKWSIENSSASESAKDGPRTPLDAEALKAAMGIMESPADSMRDSMKIAQNKDAAEDHRVRALVTFEEQVAQLDNANMMEVLELWKPLIELLESEIADVRMHAAMCCGVAVENNLRTQERLLILGAIPTLMRLATEDTNKMVRKRAATAISRAVRNFPPGLDEAVSHAPAEFKPKEKLDAHDMESVDILINKLRGST